MRKKIKKYLLLCKGGASSLKSHKTFARELRSLSIIISLLVITPTANAALYSARLDNNVPLCNEPKILEKILEKIKKYQQENPKSSIIENRKYALMLKDLRSFEEIDPQKLDIKNNYAVADKLITTKINKNVTEDQLRLCQSTGEGISKDLYLLIYRKNYETIVDIINYAPVNEEFDFVL